MRISLISKRTFLQHSLISLQVWLRHCLVERPVSRIIWPHSMIYILRFLNSTLSNRLSSVYLGGKKSSLRHLNDGHPQRSVLARRLFNVNTAHTPPTKLITFIYADYIALATQHKDLSFSKRTLNDKFNILKGNT